jgi:hypothetical protein
MLIQHFMTLDHKEVSQILLGRSIIRMRWADQAARTRSEKYIKSVVEKS